jgi:gentisate 1,2-dioxygenase
VGEHDFAWEFGDTIAMPAWQRISHQASADAVLVSLSDANLQRWTQLYRHQALD